MKIEKSDKAPRVIVFKGTQIGLFLGNTFVVHLKALKNINFEKKKTHNLADSNQSNASWSRAHTHLGPFLETIFEMHRKALKTANFRGKSTYRRSFEPVKCELDSSSKILRLR